MTTWRLDRGLTGKLIGYVHGSKPQAIAAAKRLAARLGHQVAVLPNPTRWPKVGEVWRGLRAGDRCRILSVEGSRVTVLQLDSGHRVMSDMADFLATYKPPPSAPRANRRGRKNSARKTGAQIRAAKVDFKAFADGHRSGRLDKLNGHRSDYAWFGVNDSNRYTMSYALGYRAGWNGDSPTPNPARSKAARTGRTAKRRAYGSSRARRAADSRARAIRAGGSGASELARFGRIAGRRKNPPPTPRRVRRAVASGRFAKARHHAQGTIARGVRHLELQRRPRSAAGWMRPGKNPKGHDPELDEAVRRIRAGLKRRGGVVWSVTRGTGSVYGWIYIRSPLGDMTPDEQRYLAKLLGLETVHQQGVMIPSGSRERGEYVARAEGKRPNPKGRNNPNMRVRYLPANQAWAWTWGDSMLRPAPDLPVFWNRRADLVSALDAIGIATAKNGVTTAKPGMRLPTENRRQRRLKSRKLPRRVGRSHQGSALRPTTRRRKVRGMGRSNPRESVIARARRTFRRLNEIEPGKITKVRGAKGAPKIAVKLGELVSFVYESDKYAGSPENPHGKRQLYEHRTSRPRPVLATDPSGREVHIVGGRMHPTPDGLVN